MKIWWLLIVLFGIYISTANQSLWLDEAISANVAKNNSYNQIVPTFSKYDFHPPGYYFVLKAWGDIFGYSEISVRFPSILFTLVTVFIIYKLGGISAATIVGLNPLIVYYSHEARMYALVTMTLTLVVYLLVKRRYLLSGFAAGISFVVFYGSVFLTASIAIYLLLNKNYKAVAKFSFGPIIALIIVGQLLLSQMDYSKDILKSVTNWSLVLGKANIKNLLLIPIKFSIGRISFYPKIIYFLVAGIWSVFVFAKLFRKNKYAFLFWLTLSIATVFSIFTPMLQYFRFLYLIPLLGLVIQKSRAVTIGFLIFSMIYLVNSDYHREDWKSLARNIESKVYMIDSFADPVKYYQPTIEIYDIRKKIYDSKITLIPYGEVIHGVDHKKLLEKQSFKMESEVVFRGLTKETWVRN